MEMTFGKIHDIWSRVVIDDKTLSEDEVKGAARWFDDFNVKLSDKASKSERNLQNAIKTQASKEMVAKQRKAAESDRRQLEDYVRKYDDLVNWLNTNK